MYRVVSKLKTLKLEFKKMDEANFSHIEKRADLMQMALLKCQEELWQEPNNLNLIEVERSYTMEYIKLKKAKEDFLRQKSK